MAQVLEVPDVTARWLRPLYLAAGSVFLAIGVVGAFLPLIPTTGPVLLAAFFFARSSPRMHRWLLEHPRFGRFITDFQAGRGIPRRAKITAVVAMTAAFTYNVGWVADHVALRIGIAAVGIWAIWYVLHLPTAERVPDPS